MLVKFALNKSALTKKLVNTNWMTRCSKKLTCFRACLGTILNALFYCKMGTWAHARHKSFCCPLSFSCWPFKQICINQGVSVQKLDAPVLQKMTCFRACLGTILKALAFCKMGTWAHARHKSFCCPLSFSCWPFKHLKWLPPRNHSDTAGHSTNLFFTLYIRFLGC